MIYVPESEIKKAGDFIIRCLRQNGAVKRSDIGGTLQGPWEDEQRLNVECGFPFDREAPPPSFCLAQATMQLKMQRYVTEMETHHLTADGIADSVLIPTEKLLAVYKGKEYTSGEPIFWEYDERNETVNGDSEESVEPST